MFQRHAGALPPNLQRQLPQSSGEKAHNEEYRRLILPRWLTLPGR
jgi:hypothetical protein